VRKEFLAPAVSFAVVILDYITKKIIQAHVHLMDAINVLPFLKIVHVENTGGAFGVFSGISNKIFISISLAAIVFILIYLLRTAKRLEIISLSLILGGAIGNLIDRVMIGKVIDFIDFFVGKWHWPAFNVADSALTVGIILFLLANIRQGKDSKNTQAQRHKGTEG